MTHLLIHAGYFCLIPVGVFLLITGIRLIAKCFGKEIFELPFVQKSGQFTIAKDGGYSIWLKGPVFKKTPLADFKPVIYNEQTHHTVGLHRTHANIQTNNGSVGRMQIFTFSASAGLYRLDLVEGSSLSYIEQKLGGLFHSGAADLSKSALQVRESAPIIYLVLAIPLLIISAFCIIGGLALAISALS